VPDPGGKEDGKLKRSALVTQTDERYESHKPMRTPSHSPQPSGFIPSTFTSLPPLLLSSTTLISSPPSHLTVPVGLAGSPELAAIQTVALIDCGATESFVSSSFASLHHLPTSPLTVPRVRRVIDGREIESGLVTHYTTQVMAVDDHFESIRLLVCTLGDYDVVLGTPWLQKHDPTVSWSAGSVSFTSSYCALNCSPSAASTGEQGDAEDLAVPSPYSAQSPSPLASSPPHCEAIDQDSLRRRTTACRCTPYRSPRYSLATSYQFRLAL